MASGRLGAGVSTASEPLLLSILWYSSAAGQPLCNADRKRHVLNAQALQGGQSSQGFDFGAACPLIDAQPILSGISKIHKPAAHMKTGSKALHAKVCWEDGTNVLLPRISHCHGLQSVELFRSASPDVLRHMASAHCCLRLFATLRLSRVCHPSQRPADIVSRQTINTDISIVPVRWVYPNGGAQFQAPSVLAANGDARPRSRGSAPKDSAASTGDCMGSVRYNFAIHRTRPHLSCVGGEKTFFPCNQK